MIQKLVVAVSIIVVLFTACNSKSELKKENIYGNWKCVNFSMNFSDQIKQQVIAQEGSLDGLTKSIEETKKFCMGSKYIFTDSTFRISNEAAQTDLPFNCTYDLEKKQIVYSMPQNPEVGTHTFSIKDFDGKKMTLEENIEGSSSQMFLEKIEK